MPVTSTATVESEPTIALSAYQLSSCSMSPGCSACSSARVAPACKVDGPSHRRRIDRGPRPTCVRGSSGARRDASCAITQSCDGPPPGPLGTVQVALATSGLPPRDPCGRCSARNVRGTGPSLPLAAAGERRARLQPVGNTGDRHLRALVADVARRQRSDRTARRPGQPADDGRPAVAAALRVTTRRSSSHSATAVMGIVMTCREARRNSTRSTHGPATWPW